MATSKEYLMNQLAAVHMEAGNKAQEIAIRLVEKTDEGHSAKRSELDGMIKHLEEQLRAISAELEAKKADNLGLVAQRDKDRDLVEFMKANEDKLNETVTNLKKLLQTRDDEISSLKANDDQLNELLAKEKMTATNLKKSLQTRDDEISSLKANNDRFIEEREDMPITKRVFSSMMNECEYFYIE
jgi:hypothetical protein